MPYVNLDRRLRLDELVDQLVAKLRRVPSDGDVNYVISRIVAESMRPEAGWNYEMLNRAEGTFERAGREFNRRLTVPYEIKKAQILDLPCYEEFNNES